MSRDSALFEAALGELDRAVQRGGRWTTPQRWRDYCAQHGITVKGRTPSFISLQRFSALRPELVAANAMVLRLGGGVFTLVRARAIEADFFLPSATPGAAGSSVVCANLSDDARRLFGLLGAFAESDALEFAASSGVLATALRLDRPSQITMVRRHAKHHFAFRPLGASDDTLSYSGQVEVDGVFIARRAGARCLFVVEAKHTGRPCRLAKHKLLFGCHALLGGVGAPRPGGEGLTVVPVSIRSWQRDGRLAFEIVECDAFASAAIPAIDQLQARAPVYVSVGLEQAR